MLVLRIYKEEVLYVQYDVHCKYLNEHFRSTDEIALQFTIRSEAIEHCEAPSRLRYRRSFSSLRDLLVSTPDASSIQHRFHWREAGEGNSCQQTTLVDDFQGFLLVWTIWDIGTLYATISMRH